MKSMDRAIEMAVEIISNSGREKPADRVLRDRLRIVPRSQGELRASISKAVFAWFKWHRCLDVLIPSVESVLDAVKMNGRFQANPETFDTDSLRQRVIPRWYREAHECEDGWMRSLQLDSRLWLRARSGRQGALMEGVGGVERVNAGPWPNSLEYLGNDDLFRTAAFHRGDFEIQDICSQAVGLMCEPVFGETWWDACAGEGGKTLHLSDLMENKGLIWATDPARWRLEKLKRRAARAGVYNYRAVPWSNTGVLPTRNQFDGVLVDAPCSGVGTWQRNPHARWTTGPKDIRELADIQIRLLSMCGQALKPGGKIIYAVCTLTQEETESVADAFEEQDEGMEAMPLSNPFEANGPRHSRIWLWPQKTGGNGMFIAAWKRRKG